MIGPVDPWCVRETSLDPDRLDAAASVFALSNGHLGVRGALDEDHPGVGPATFMESVHEERPQRYTEGGYGYPETDERLVALPDGWAVDATVDGDRLDTRTGDVQHHERALDLRAGVLDRRLRWRAPSGATIELSSRRLVSFARRDLVATSFELRAVDPVRVVLRPFRCWSSRGARAEAAEPEERPVVRTMCHHDVEEAWTLHSVPSTGIRALVAGDVQVDASAGVAVQRGRTVHGTSVTVDLLAGQSVSIHLLVACAAGREAAQGDLHAAVRSALDGARDAGWDRLQAEQRDHLDAVWERADVELHGDPELQQAVRFAMFQLVQAAARAEVNGIRAKGLTGDGYHGHTFWDADTFVVPVLNHVLPEAADRHLRWRRTTLPEAVRRARSLDLDGAAFPWRTITGRECSGYWPASTAAFHVTGDVADAAVRHLIATGDERFGRDVAVDLAVHAARLWVSLGHHCGDTFRIDGVTGPDEYSAVADNNTYTNLMARRNLRWAAELTRTFPEQGKHLGVTDDERGRWAAAAEAMARPYDAALGVTQQAESFTRHARWDFTGTGPDDYPLDTSATYGALYRRQVVKQADLVLALYLAGDEFGAEQKRRDFDYYEPLTVRDSTLSAPAQAVVAAEVGHLELAYAYARETALVDLHDLHGSTSGGLHLAALAGAWTALVAGFGGLREGDGGLHLAPRLPSRLSGLRFRLRRCGAVVEVSVERAQVTYRLLCGAALELSHEGRPVRLTAADPCAVRPLSPVVELAPPRQPPHRAPLA